MTRLTRLLGLTARTTKCQRVTAPKKFKELVWVNHPGLKKWKAVERIKIPFMACDRHTPAFEKRIEQWEKEGRGGQLVDVPEWCDTIIVHEGVLVKFLTHGQVPLAERVSFVTKCLEDYSAEGAYVHYKRVIRPFIVPYWVEHVEMENRKILMIDTKEIVSEVEMEAFLTLLKEHYIDYTYHSRRAFPTGVPLWIKTFTIHNGVVQSITKFPELTLDKDEGSRFKKVVEAWIKAEYIQNHHYQAIPKWIHSITIAHGVVMQLSTSIMEGTTPATRGWVLKHLMQHYPNLTYKHAL